jgi:uncharacterized membrane protein YhaH (DUF805 family)
MNWRNWIDGRASRREYWLYVLLLIGLSVLMSHLPGYTANFALLVLMTLVQVRRLHDLGRTGWWALGVLLAPVAPMLALLPVMSLEDASLVGSLFALLLIGVVGALPGAPGENRFGPPPRFTWLAFFQGR